MVINFFGDFCQEGRTKRFTIEDYQSSMDEVARLTMSADYNIVNLECAPDISRGVPIKKVGPHLSCNKIALQSLKQCGFDCLALANNHFADFGPESVIDSIRLIDSMGFDYVGAGENLASARKTLIVNRQGITVAIINCCEHEFSIAENRKAGCHPLDPVIMSQIIRDASDKADYVLVYLHGGNEHNQLPTPRMQTVYRFFIDCGADMVVNCHQHCFSGYEYYHEKPIVYGLGNFYFDIPGKENSLWNYGYVLQVSLKDRLTIKPIPYKQCVKNPVVSFLTSQEQHLFAKQLSSLNMLIEDVAEVQKAYDKWVDDNAVNYLNSLFPLSKKCFVLRKWDRLKKKLFCSKLGDQKVLRQEQWMLLYSFFHCESHRDVMISILKNKF